jgi:hypothetical protein
MNSPIVRLSIIIVPAIGASCTDTAEAPIIIHSEAVYPLLKAIIAINTIGKASDLKTTGSWLLDTRQSRKRGTNTVLRIVIMVIMMVVVMMVILLVIMVIVIMNNDVVVVMITNDGYKL